MKTTTELRQTIVNLRTQLEKKNQEIDWLKGELEYAQTKLITKES